MKTVFYALLLSYACDCYCRSLPGAAENIQVADEKIKSFKKIKSGYFKIPKTEREVQMHDILHHLKGAVLESHDHNNDRETRRKRGTKQNYKTDQSYPEKEEYCAPRYNLGSSIYHRDVTIGEGGSVVNIGNLYMYQYSSDGEYHRQIPIPGFSFPIPSDDNKYDSEYSDGN